MSVLRLPCKDKPHSTHQLALRQLGRQSYLPVWQAMRERVAQPEGTQHSELWFVEHNPVFTQGQAGKPEHILAPGDIPVIQTDRGGQITYHGPGQAVIYVLIDLREANIGIRSLVNAIEEAVIHLLKRYNITGQRRSGAPGIYVNHAKIASIGLRVKKFRTYHGVSINTGMDLEPFNRINPCGYEGQAVTDLLSLGITADIVAIQHEFAQELAQFLGYTIC